MTSPHPHTLSPVTRFLILLALLASTVAPSSAAAINYGPFGPVAPGVSFIDVEENSITDAVPLYGPPNTFATGLDFDPTGFGATSSSGGIDLTNGQLTFSILTDPNVGVTSLAVFEAGDYTLRGSGTNITSVTSGVILRATVTQINGVNVAPINLVPVNASFGDSLPGEVTVAPWSVGVLLDVAAQLGLPAGSFATGLDVSIDNTLTAASEANSTAFNNKTEFQFEVGTVVIPEPGTGILLLGTLLAPALARRRRRRC